METNTQPRSNRRVVLNFLYCIVIAAVFLYFLLVYLHILPGILLGEVVVAAVFGFVVIEVLASLIYYYYIRNIHKAEAATLSSITRILGYAILFFMLLYIVFPDFLGGIFVSAGFLGIILGLAAQSTLSNFIAGIYLLASNTLEPNDNVVIHTWQYTLQPQSYPHDKFVPGIAGVIESIGTLYTKLVNDEGLPVYIPNNIVAQALVINYHRAKEHMRKIQFDVDVTVPYNRLEKAIAGVIKRNGISVFTINLEYLHQGFYVVTIHVKIQEGDIKELKSRIFNEIIKEINATGKHSRHSKGNSGEPDSRTIPPEEYDGSGLTL